MRLPGRKTSLYGVTFVLFLVVFAYLLLTDSRRVDGTSMYPTLEEGDLVIIQDVSMNDVHIGDVIVYGGPCSYGSISVIHRVVGTQGGGFITQGDNNPQSDQKSGIAPSSVKQDCLIGKVYFVIPYIERLASLPYGLNYAIALLIFLIIIVSEFRRRRLAPDDGLSSNDEPSL